MPRNLFAGRGFELLRELPKCDTGHEVSKCCWEKKALIDWFAAGLPQTFNLLKKKKKGNYLQSTIKQCLIKQGMLK